MANLNYLSKFLPYNWHMARIRKEVGDQNTEQYNFDSSSVIGAKSEMQVVAWLNSLTGEDHIIFNHVLVPDYTSSTKDVELDIISLSPRGISIIEVKGHSGRIEVNNTGWIQHFDDGKRTMPNPQHQCFRQIKALRSLLTKHELKIPVTAMIVMPNATKIIEHDNARLPVINNINKFKKSSEWFNELPTLSPDKYSRAIEIIGSLNRL